MVITLSALAPTEIIKFEKARKRALTTVPDKIRLEVVILPCIEAMMRTAIVAKIAPRKAPRLIITFKPRMMLKVAPKLHPQISLRHRAQRWDCLPWTASRFHT